MALDTTIGGAAADSYGTHADYVTYTGDLGFVLTGTMTTQEEDLRRATMYLDRQYQAIGNKAVVTQALQWPRIDTGPDPDGYTIANNIIPIPWISAQFEIAYVFDQGTDLFAFTSGAAVKKETVKAGPASSATEYFDNSLAEARLIAVEGLLRGYITGPQPGDTGGFAPFVRG